jgi:hypothetical protein
MEGALVRRAPLPLTRRRGEAGLAARRTRSPVLSSRGGRGCVDLRGSRQRASEVTSRARFAAENAATGRCRAEELSIEAPPGSRGAPSSRKHASARGSGSESRERAQGTGRERWLKLEGRRQAMLHPWIGRRSNDRRQVGVGARSPARGDREWARAGIGWSVLGARVRKSVAEVGERHLSPCPSGVPKARGASAGIA